MIRYTHGIIITLLACLSLTRASSQLYIKTVAGSGYNGTSGDGGPALCAGVPNPTGVCIDPTGNIYIAAGNAIRRVDATTSIITTIAGSDSWGYSGDGGPATNALMKFAYDLCMDPTGNIYVSEYGGHRIRRISTSGIITTVAGTGVAGFSGDGGAATAAKLNTPHGIFADGQGNLFIADKFNQRIRKVDAATGIITTIVGDGTISYSGDGGPAVNATTPHPGSVAVDDEGNVYFTESTNGISCRVRRIDAVTGIITTIAGSNVYGHSGDGGLAVNADLFDPVSVEVDIQHNVYVLEYDAPRFRKITAATGIINTIAGTGANSFTGDGGLSINGSMFSPRGTVLGFNGNFYIADVQNQRIRVLTTTLPEPPVISKVSVTINPELPCFGTTVTFEAAVQNAGTGQSYQWYVNNNPVGPNSATFSTTNVNDGDLVKCVFSSDQCSGREAVTSSEIAVVFGSATAPTVSISSTAAKVCPGEPVTLTTSVQNGSGISYQWYMNNGAVGDDAATFTYTPVNSEDHIRCDVSSAGCAGGVISTETVSTGVYPVPAVTITPQESTVPPGTVVQLSANITGELKNYSWISVEPLSGSTAITAVTAPVINSHPVIFSGETADGCVVSDTMNIYVFIKMVMPNAFSPNRDGNNDIFRIPPNVKFTLKEFAIFDRWGRKVFATADVTRGWTGENAVNGTYVYMITGEIDGQKAVFKGTVVLSR